MQVIHRSTALVLLLMLATACAERPSAPTAPSMEPSRIAFDASAGAPAPTPLVTVQLPTQTVSPWPVTGFGFGVQSGPGDPLWIGPAHPRALRAAPLQPGGGRTAPGLPHPVAFHRTRPGE